MDKAKAEEEIDFEANDSEPLEKSMSPEEALIDVEQEEKDQAKARAEMEKDRAEAKAKAKAKAAKKAEVEAKAKTEAGKGSKGPILVIGGGFPKIRSEVVVPPRRKSPVRPPRDERSARPGPSKERSPQPGPSGVCYPIGKNGATLRILHSAPKTKPILT